jgi:hypothetical protein
MIEKIYAKILAEKRRDFIERGTPSLAVGQPLSSKRRSSEPRSISILEKLVGLKAGYAPVDRAGWSLSKIMFTNRSKT